MCTWFQMLFHVHTAFRTATNMKFIHFPIVKISRDTQKIIYPHTNAYTVANRNRSCYHKIKRHNHKMHKYKKNIETKLKPKKLYNRKKHRFEIVHLQSFEMYFMLKMLCMLCDEHTKMKHL